MVKISRCCSGGRKTPVRLGSRRYDQESVAAFKSFKEKKELDEEATGYKLSVLIIRKQSLKDDAKMDKHGKLSETLQTSFSIRYCRYTP